MDEQLWERMPEDCLHKILARVPLPSAFRLRSVCKRWKAFIFSEAFFSLQPQPSSRGRCFLLCTHGHLACVYSFTLQRWHYLQLPSIASRPARPLSLAAASQSLFCFASQVSECSHLWVCNPFTKSLKLLPSMAKIRLIHKLSLSVDSSGKSYRIIVAGEDGNHSSTPRIYKLLTELYDSSSDTWTMAGSPSPEAKFGLNPGVWCRGIFYCITEMPYAVAAFDMAAKTWKELSVEMPARLATPNLMERGGRLLLAGRIKHPGGRKTESINIWELRELVWGEIAQMPEHLCREFVQPLHPLTPLVCAAVEDGICITTHLSARVLLFDLSTSRWRWLPPDPLFPTCRNFHLLGFPLEPRMDTLP